VADRFSSSSRPCGGEACPGRPGAWECPSAS
jgi:hypothetical protein